MLRPWAEGAQVGTVNPGQGEPAQPGETTWTHAFFPTNAWTTPGCAPGVDFVWLESSFQFIYGVNESPYLFESTPETVGDVTAWVRNPAANFGWMLRCAEEGTIFTGRRFGSREDANNPPTLEIDYLVPPVIGRLQTHGTNLQFSFAAWANHNYQIQYKTPATTSTWQTLATLDALPQPSLVLFVEPVVAPGRFYRLVAF